MDLRCKRAWSWLDYGLGSWVNLRDKRLEVGWVIGLKYSGGIAVVLVLIEWGIKLVMFMCASNNILIAYRYRLERCMCIGLKIKYVIACIR